MVELTELEGCVLGLVWSAGSCTPYEIRKEFLRSPSVHWSGSSGTVYPLVERLKRRRLLRSAKKRQGRREALEYSLTRRGREGLEQWVANGPSDERVLAPPIDPLRTRLRFLEALPPPARGRVLERTREALRAHLAAAERYCREHLEAGDRAAYLVGRGAYLALEARLAWIEEMVPEVGFEPTRV